MQVTIKSPVLSLCSLHITGTITLQTAQETLMTGSLNKNGALPLFSRQQLLVGSSRQM